MEIWLCGKVSAPINCHLSLSHFCVRRGIGLMVFNHETDPEKNNVYEIISCKEGKKGGWSETFIYTLRAVQDPSAIKELDDYALGDGEWFTLPPSEAANRWQRYQSKRIAEGVWMATADPAFITKVNQLVDVLAAQEPVDYHPGTNEVVRDLVHPSLYPLLLDPDTIDTTKRNHFNRKYEKSRFQWLPSEVDIDQDGNAKITSPINNLDSDKYPDLHQALEQLFTALVPGLEKVWEYSQIAFFSDVPSEIVEDYQPVPHVSFKGSRLQAVVKLADYVFQPGTTFNGVWHYEGMSHENIVTTGLFYPASDDRLGGGLEFKRQFTDVEGCRLLFGVAQSRPPWLNETIAEGFAPLGFTTTETGKLMVFPNCHAHRVMEMVNNTDETLRRRLIVFFIVDPNNRIASSENHSPMPRKISRDAALADRLELMQERKQAKQDLNPRIIELCEH